VQKNNTKTVVAQIPPGTPMLMAFCVPDPGPVAKDRKILNFKEKGTSHFVNNQGTFSLL
jgi:hypothetical protein